MTPQKAFNTVARHIAKQKHRSVNLDGLCLYRSLDGDRCAIGAMIPNKLYKTSMERKTVGTLIDRDPTIEELFKDIFPGEPATDHFSCNKREQFLRKLQKAHDERPNWEASGAMMVEELTNIGKSFKLDISVLDKLDFTGLTPRRPK